jgi:hypothetical protein
MLPTGSKNCVPTRTLRQAVNRSADPACVFFRSEQL